MIKPSMETLTWLRGKRPEDWCRFRDLVQVCVPSPQTDGFRAARSWLLWLRVPGPSRLGRPFFHFSEGSAVSQGLRVEASPQSLCALRAVDKSVLLMKPEAELSASKVYNLALLKAIVRTKDEEEEDEEDCIRHVSTDTLPYQILDKNEKDLYSLVKDMGLKVFTNLKIKYPKLCTFYSMPVLVADTKLNERMTPLTLPKTVRSYFPETWIWELVVVK